jgi:hypothetical protein
MSCVVVDESLGGSLSIVACDRLDLQANVQQRATCMTVTSVTVTGTHAHGIKTGTTTRHVFQEMRLDLRSSPPADPRVGKVQLRVQLLEQQSKRYPKVLIRHP